MSTETKIELYMCEECETAVSKPFGTDETGVLCEKHWDNLCARADAAYDAWKEEQLLNEFA